MPTTKPNARQGDPNVMQRLRAWRPRVEILLPWSLREQAAREVEQERQLYYDSSADSCSNSDTTRLSSSTIKSEPPSR